MTRRQPLSPAVAAALAALALWDGAALAQPPPRKINPDRLAAAGIRRVEGVRLTLYTDLPKSADVDELPAVFAEAYPQWCRYFELPEQVDPPWRMTAYLMQEQARFESSGLWDERLPDFKSGYCLDYECWCRVHPTPYYRRHLLLHEGTHGFIRTRLGGMGPTWYAEGMAELFGTHAWRDGKLTMGYVPRSRDESDGWGRSRVIRDAYKRREAWPLPKIFSIVRTGDEDEAYSWCWAATSLLDGNPRFRERFRRLRDHIRGDDLQEQLQASFADDWRELVEEWQLFVSEMQYGYDLSAARIHHAPGEALPRAGKSVPVAADRAWQSSGILLQKGRRYQLKARGQFQIAETTKPWIAEPGGVSIRYYQGFPLGCLVAAIRPPEFNPEVHSPLLSPIRVGLETTLAPSEDGVLYLRLMDSPAELGDNKGEATVEVEEIR